MTTPVATLLAIVPPPAPCGGSTQGVMMVQMPMIGMTQASP